MTHIILVGSKGRKN